MLKGLRRKHGDHCFSGAPWETSLVKETYLNRDLNQLKELTLPGQRKDPEARICQRHVRN